MCMIFIDYKRDNCSETSFEYNVRHLNNTSKQIFLNKFLWSLVNLTNARENAIVDICVDICSS